MSIGRVVHEARAEREQQQARDRAVALRLAAADTHVDWSPPKWEEIRQRLRESATETQWELWLSSLHPHRMDGDTLVLGCNPDLAGWVGPRFRVALEQAAGGTVRVVGCTRAAA